jgi:hypothetical protein
MTDSKNSSGTPEIIEVESMDEILGTTASVVISSDEDSKKSVLDRTGTDSSFLDKPLEDGNDEDLSDNLENPDLNKDVKDKDSIEEVLDKGLTEELEDYEEEESKNKGGRKPALVEAMSKLVDRGIITLFEDSPDITKYTIEDIEELIESNISEKVDQTAQDAPMEIFKRLDPKLQDVVAYALNGGQDITNVLKTVAQSQEVSDLSLDNEKDQERIIREHLRSINYGDSEVIEDEILSIIDRGDLEKKATSFKPKLDEKQASIMQNKLAAQEESKKRATKASEKYAETVFNHLNKSDLNGLPLTNKVQTMLYHGLTESNQYQDRNGNPTNALGHLIEEHQFGENGSPSVLLEALWLMADPQGYRNSVLTLGQKGAHAKTLRSLKTAESETTTSSNKQGEGGKTPTREKNVRRQTGNRSIFARK